MGVYSSTVKFDPTAENNGLPFQTDGMCNICFTEYKETDNVSIMKACDHHYHEECIKPWIVEKGPCLKRHGLNRSELNRRRGVQRRGEGRGEGRGARSDHRYPAKRSPGSPRPTDKGRSVSRNTPETSRSRQKERQ